MSRWRGAWSVELLPAQMSKIFTSPEPGVNRMSAKSMVASTMGAEVSALLMNRTATPPFG